MVVGVSHHLSTSNNDMGVCNLILHIIWRVGKVFISVSIYHDCNIHQFVYLLPTLNFD